MQKLHVKGKHHEDAEWVNWSIEVHNRTELLDWVKDLRNFGYWTFGLYLENGAVLLECSEKRVYWYKVVGFRP